MRDLYASGKQATIDAIGTINPRSIAYADGYLINGLSDASLKDTFKQIILYSGLGMHEIKKLDGRICDLAAAYGKFSHATGIATENLEINPVIIERAKDFVASGTRYTQGVMQDINQVYGNNRFDHIIFSLSFHYASDNEKGQLLFDIYNTLIEGGHLYLTEPLASIDQKGRETLTHILEQTGYKIRFAGEGSIEDKRFYKIIAQKNGAGTLYNQPFKLRDFSESDFDSDEIKINRDELRNAFLKTVNPDVTAGLEWELTK
jgi:SAM-dependent methyltransferase